MGHKDTSPPYEFFSKKYKFSRLCPVPCGTYAENIVKIHLPVFLDVDNKNRNSTESKERKHSFI